EEVVVVDSGSTDETVAICERHGARVVHQPWLGFGRQKNVAIEHCSGDWVLLIDADEVVSPALRRDILQSIQSPTHAVYEVAFHSYCLGRRVRIGGWGRFHRIRLFRDVAGRYNDNRVHEGFVTPHPVRRLAGHLDHHTYLDSAEYFAKFNTYT